MSAIHHPNYRVIPGQFRGFWTGVCKLCPADRRQFKTTKNGFPDNAERAVWEHLRTEHDIEAKEATA